MFGRRTLPGEAAILRACRAAIAGGVCAALLAFSGCGGGAGAAADGRLAVVATTTQVGDLVRNVGGRAVDVHQILAPNTDPHEYEVRPRDVEAVSRATLIFSSGGDVDKWLAGAVRSAGSNARVVVLIDSVRRIGDDPHWWQDPRNFELATVAVRDALARAEPRAAAAFRANAARYLRRLRALDAAVGRCIAKVPAAQRKLVTTHDALGYFARRYGIRVIGTVIPSLTTAGQPSAGETAALVATIRREHVKAIFAESSVNPKVEAAIARETGAKVGRALWADTLGPKRSDGATYIASIEANTRALVEGFTGGAVGC